MIAEKLRQIQKTATATNPQGISGLTVWLKADAGLIDGSGAAITANGTEIATWQNQASGGTHYNKSGLSGAGPTYRNGANGKYGLPVVDFNGASTQGMTHADLSAYSTGGVTIFTICKWTSGQAWSANDGAGGVNYPVSSYHPRSITGGDGVTSFATTNDDAGYTGWNFTKFASNVGISYEYYPYGTPSTITTAAFASRGAAQTADCIGKHAYNADWLTGQIGELIIYNRKLTDSECATIKTYLLVRWGMASIDNVAMLLHMDGVNGSTTFTDNGPNALTVTAVGNAQISTAQSKYGGASAYFDGTGDYLTIASNAAFSFGQGDFTIECWVYPTASTGIFGVYGTSGGSGSFPKFVMHLDSLTPKIHYNVLTGGSNIYTNATSAIAVNQWTHLAFVRQGTTWTWYINGTASGTGSNSTTITFTSQTTFIGYGGESYFSPFLGYIEEFRIKKGEAVYTTTFTPTGPFPNS